MMDSLDALIYAINKYKDLIEELDDMSDAWEHGDECAQASNDPGLQFEQGCKVSEKYEEIIAMCADTVQRSNSSIGNRGDYGD